MEIVAKPFEITRIRLQNIRGFRELDLDISSHDGAPRKRTLIIGKNGTCKSTILRVIAIGLADITDASRLVSEPIGGLVSEAEAQGEITIDALEAEEHSRLTKFIDKLGDKESVRRLSSRSDRGTPFVCAYGAGRFGAGAESGRGYRIADSVVTLFRYQESLIDPELTLHRLRSFFGRGSYDRTIRGLKRALGLSDEDRIEVRDGGGVVVSGPTVGGRVPLEGWADGYRLTFNWILDLYAWAMRAGSLDEDGHVEGILLIDEIEQHLHPSMQAEILPRLSELFPKMQIFATTHSPLVALDASPEEVVVLRREGDQIVAEENVPNFFGYSVEDMLADPRLFDSEVSGQEKRKLLTEYHELAAIPKDQRDAEQRQRLRSLATEVRTLEGYTERENETSRLLKEFTAKYDL